jgi:aspartyl-tRNA(Asn)/glutamyl-tRNA(Gln) amidotransferase subunit C
MNKINKETLKHLEELARIEIDEKKQEKMISDLGNILGHFEELREVNTEGIEPMAGGTVEKNIFREDNDISSRGNREKIIDSFPEKDGDFLKVPAIFE